MSPYEHHQLLKFLYFEGYADSYQEADYLLEEMNDDDFSYLYEEVIENKKIINRLLDEGYAETPEAAEAIMMNMSEEWRESICEELTGERRRRALEKGTPLANRVARAKEGQPRERTGPPYLGATKKAPIKRGGIGDKGRGKSEWTGYESDRGSGNRAARRAGKKVRDTSDEV